MAKRGGAWRRALLLIVLAATLLLSGCGGEQSPLSPKSPAARDIADLWWWMLAVAAIVFFGAVAMLLLAWRRRDRPGLPFFGQNERVETRLVIGFGMVVPAIVLVALFAVSNLYVIRD